MEILIGLIVGLTIGAAGVGGGTLTAPALMLLLGMSPASAVATALMFSALIKVGAAATYLKRRQVDFKTLGYLLAGGLPGAFLGAIFLGRLYGGRSQNYVLILVGSIVAVCASAALWRMWRKTKIVRLSPKLLPAFSLPIGLELGFSSVGAGVLGSVLLLSTTTLPAATVVGTDLSFGLVLSAVGGGVHAMAGRTDWHVLMRLLPAGLIASLVAARYAGIMPTRRLRAGVLVLSLALGLVLLNKGAHQLRPALVQAVNRGAPAARQPERSLAGQPPRATILEPRR